MAAVQGVYDTLKALRDGVPHGDIEYYAKAGSDETGDAQQRLRPLDERLLGRII